MNSKTPILDELLKYKEENNLILSMPGNKSGIGFLRDEIGCNFVNNLGFLDITEVDPLDNLHNPEGIIKESQKLLANTYGVKKAFFLVNGSTSGNLASIFAVFKEGDEVLVERNCHKSIYNGLILRKIRQIYIETNIDVDYEVLLPCTENNILKAMDKAHNPNGIIITTPNYYGISTNLNNVFKLLKDKGLKIIVDAAHGAHYGFNEKLPKGIFNIVDYIITSAHKTLPSLTQGAYLLVNDKDSNVEFYINAFNTTSPSYLIMASLEYGRYYLDKYSNDDYSKLINMAEEYKDKINKLNKVKILCDKDINKNINQFTRVYEEEIVNEELERKYVIDKSRYIMNLPKGYSCSKLLEYFRSKKIQCEMSFSNGVVLLLSPFNTKDDFDKILKAIEELEIKVLEVKDINVCSEKIDYKPFTGIKKLEPFEVFDMDFKEVKLENSLGGISKDYIIPYPPGIPLILPGEEITEEVIQLINKYNKSSMSILGVNNNKVKIEYIYGGDT